nr:G protein-coupled receptor [Proales similis]
MNASEPQQPGIFPRYSNIGSYVFLLVYALIFVVGVTANLLVIVVLGFKNKLRQLSNYVFVNLSIADLLVLLVTLPVAMVDLFSPDVWLLGRFYCKAYYFTEYWVTSVSSLNIVIISLERYLALSSPYKVRQVFSNTRTFATISAIWILGSLVSVPFLFMTDYRTSPSQCLLDMNHTHLLYVIGLNLTFVFVPTAVLAVLYIYIIAKLRRHCKSFRSFENCNMSLRSLPVAATPALVSSPAVKNSESLISPPVPAASSSSSSSSSSGTARSELRRVKFVEAPNSDEAKTGRKQTIGFCVRIFNCQFSCLCNQHELSMDESSSQNERKRNTNGQSRMGKGWTRARAASSGTWTTRLYNSDRGQSMVVRNEVLKRDIFNNTCGDHNSASTNRVNYTIIISLVTLVFFCCQLPMRAFLMWSYYKHHFEEVELSLTMDDIRLISFISNLLSLIYFLHCISNPIIYNILSKNFRSAFFRSSLLSKH